MAEINIKASIHQYKGWLFLKTKANGCKLKIFIFEKISEKDEIKNKLDAWFNKLIITIRIKIRFIKHEIKWNYPNQKQNICN